MWIVGGISTQPNINIDPRPRLIPTTLVLTLRRYHFQVGFHDNANAFNAALHVHNLALKVRVDKGCACVHVYCVDGLRGGVEHLQSHLQFADFHKCVRYQAFNHVQCAWDGGVQCVWDGVGVWWGSVVDASACNAN